MTGHTKKKCYPTKCRYCKRSVLYYESEQGAKVFFNFPIRQGFQVHICDGFWKAKMEKTQSIRRKPRRGGLWVKKSYREILNERQTIPRMEYECPVCTKHYEDSEAFFTHIFKQMKQDDVHFEFFNQYSFSSEHRLFAETFPTDSDEDVFGFSEHSDLDSDGPLPEEDGEIPVDSNIEIAAQEAYEELQNQKPQLNITDFLVKKRWHFEDGNGKSHIKIVDRRKKE